MNPLHYLSYAGYMLGVRVLRGLPLPTAQRMAGAIGRRVFDLGGTRVGYAMVNLRVAFPDLPDEELRGIGRKSYEHLALNVIDIARSAAWTQEDLRQHVSFSGVENAEAALAKGRGAIGLSLHMGNFELARAAALDVPLSVVLRPRRNPLLDRKIAQMRADCGCELIEHRNAARRILRSLRKGRLVGVLNDQYIKRWRGVMAPLFGARCSTAAGVATLALRSRAPVVPFYIVRDAPDHHQGFFLPELETPNTGDRKQDIVAATTIHNSAIEAIIRKHPEQWIWAHRRFRHSPDLPENPYTR